MTAPELDPVWGLIRERSLRDGDFGYADFVTKWPLRYYAERIRQIGFVGLDHVLDVGCGFGQWLVALAALNRRVTGIDVDAKRITTAEAMINSLWLDNARARFGGATEIPFPDESFDAVFCCGVFMFLDRRKALAEFRRVLRPGGVLFVSTNGRGWWLKLALQNLVSSRHLVGTGLRAFWLGRRNGIPNATDIADVLDLLKPFEFFDANVAGEGRLTHDGSKPRVKPHYPATFLGYDCVIDFSARKSGAPQQRKRIFDNLVEKQIEEVLAADTYSYRKQLARFPTSEAEDTGRVDECSAGFLRPGRGGRSRSCRNPPARVCGRDTIRVLSTGADRSVRDLCSEGVLPSFRGPTDAHERALGRRSAGVAVVPRLSVRERREVPDRSLRRERS